MPISFLQIDFASHDLRGSVSHVVIPRVVAVVVKLKKQQRPNERREGENPLLFILPACSGMVVTDTSSRKHLTGS